MSRYEIKARDPARHHVTAGWDDPLGTYFFTVDDMAAIQHNRLIEGAMRLHLPESRAWEHLAAELADDTALCWRGGTVGEITSVDALSDLLAPYADIPLAVVARLEDERQNAAPLSQIQQKVRDILTRDTPCP